MRKHTFSTAAAAGMPQRDATATVPSYDEATDKQRRAAYDDGVFGQGMTVPTQTKIRTRLEKGGLKTQADLDAFATAAFMARLNRTPMVEQPTVDAKAANLTPEQVKFFESNGYLVLNK